MKFSYKELKELGVDVDFTPGEESTASVATVALIAIAKSLKRIADNSDKMLARPTGAKLTSDDIFAMSRR